MIVAAVDAFPPLSGEERDELIRLARESVRSSVRMGRNPELHLSTPTLLAPGGAFVTLRLQGELRGCIGAVAPPDPLYATVIRMAQASTRDDPRFPPLKPDEGDAVTIEISRLGPLRQVTADSVDPTRHGLYVVYEGAHGLLLPQVAIRMGWSREQLLAETCRKAGLSADAWRNPAAGLFVFEAEVFSEAVPSSAEGG